jgi:hypothetical protein
LNEFENLLLAGGELGAFGQAGDVAENSHGVAPDDVWVCVNGGVLEGPLAAPAVLFE